jgi:hypothetical protein
MVTSLERISPLSPPILAMINDKYAFSEIFTILWLLNSSKCKVFAFQNVQNSGKRLLSSIL